MAARACAAALLSYLLVGFATAEVDVSEIQTKLKAKQELVVSIKTKVETQYAEFNSTSRNLANCFGASGLVGGKSLSGCGADLPADLSPTCDARLGSTKSCGCSGKKFVSKVAIKARSPNLDPQAELRAANVACFAAGAPMAEVFKGASEKSDNEHKLMYFGSVVSKCHPSRLSS